MRRILYLFCLTGWIFGTPMAQAIEPVVLRDGLEQYHLGPAVELLEDPTGQLTLEDILKPEQTRRFRPSQSDTPNPGFSRSAWWVRIMLMNQTEAPKRWLLEVAQPNLDRITLYRRASMGWKNEPTGRLYPFLERPLKHRHFVFPLDTRPGLIQTFYLRIESSASFALPMTLMSEAEFAARDHEAQMGLGFYYGLVFVMILFNLILWLSLRDRNYLYYVFTLMFLHLLFQLTDNGLAYEYLWPTSVWWQNHCMGFFLGTAIFFTVLFSQSFLNTRQQLPRLHIALEVIKYTGLMLGFFNLAPDNSWFSHISIFGGTKTGIIAAIAVWGAGLAALIKGYKPARYYLLAWSFLLLGALISGFRAQGLLPSNIYTTYALQLGSALEILLVSLALGDRLQVAQKAMIAAQRDKLNQERLAKEAQAQLVAELQRLDTLKDEFMANISHELRTPLNGIIGISESLVDGVAGELHPDQKANLSLVISSGRRLYSLVNDLLDFSRLRHREIQLQLRPVELRAAVDVVLKLSRPLLVNRPLTLNNLVSDTLPPAWVDEDRLQQILHNLIGNAIKFTPTGTVEVLATVQEAQIAITVADTGIGIAPDQQARIFDSFQQADGSTTREYGGTGLGLSITRQLVELQGGTLTVDSALGQGSRFTFTLPVAQEQATLRPRVIVPGTGDLRELAAMNELSLTVPEGDPGFQILVVDDEPVNLQVLVNMLALQHYTVTKAADGPEALRLLRQRKFDLVLLDVMMPRMSGYEVCEQIRQIYPAQELPVVFLSAKNQEPDRVHGFESGANDYLSKPVARHELLARIKTHLHLSKLNLSYARFVPAEFLHYLGHESILEVQLGDQIQQEMTILFSDIRAFSTLSEQLSPKQNFDFINAYLQRMSPLIRMNAGFIDKYIGDGMMALFPDSPQTALEAALEMIQELANLNAERTEQGETPIQIGIGLHTGLLMLGTIGEAERMEGTVISDAVNIAARLEGITKVFGTTLVISEQTRAGLDDPERCWLRFLGRIKVKGKDARVGVYEVLEEGTSPDFALRQKTQETFEAAVEAFFAQDLATALTEFQAVFASNPADTAAEFYIQRCERFLAQGIPEHWDTVTPGV
jgi:signal transduction histidine kinase/class 3 adenylate cyclase